VVVNKVDRPGARPDWVVNATFDLFDKLGATEDQLDFAVVYASALNGYAVLDLADAPSPHAPSGEHARGEDNVTHGAAGDKKLDMRPLFDTVISRVPSPPGDPEGPLQLQISNIDYSSYVGRIGIGRVARGKVRPGQDVLVMTGDQEQRKAKINQVLGFRGLERVQVDEAIAGDIVLINGIEGISIGQTIADPAQPEALPMLKVASCISRS
jgi:GTP-binding protein